jgi:8-oxo-dGTP pyrophosphatase MutT (NUDIX family)
MVVTCGIYLLSAPAEKILVCHATHASWKQWSIPKGLKEGNETLWEAATRELLEETGLDIKDFTIRAVHALPPIKYKNQNKVLEAFLVVIDATCEFLNTLIKESKVIGEVDSWKWITIGQAYRWLHESQRKNLKVIKKLIHDSHELQPE